MSEYVTIERADNEAIAEMIRQRLEESGIPCVVAPGNMGAVAGAGGRTTWPSRTTGPTRPASSWAPERRDDRGGGGGGGGGRGPGWRGGGREGGGGRVGTGDASPWDLRGLPLVVED